MITSSSTDLRTLTVFSRHLPLTPSPLLFSPAFPHNSLPLCWFLLPGGLPGLHVDPRAARVRRQPVQGGTQQTAGNRGEVVRWHVLIRGRSRGGRPIKFRLFGFPHVYICACGRVVHVNVVGCVHALALLYLYFIVHNPLSNVLYVNYP